MTGPATDHRIGFTIVLSAIAVLAAIALAVTAGTPTAGTAFALAIVAGSALVLTLHVYPEPDGH